MQPYFFPYIGYYSLIKHTDEWIIFDVVQFIRHGWIERNRVLKPGEGWQYIAVPLQKSDRNTLIKDMRIRGGEDWRDKMLRQLAHYKKAPFYTQTVDLIRDALNLETDSIVTLNAHILQKTCDYLSIPIQQQIFSEMNLEIGTVTHPGEWALQISIAMGADEYINPPGGMDIFEQQQFDDAGIKLSFLKNNLPVYSQRRPVFENGLSVIDVLMYNDVAAVNRMIDDCSYVEKTLSGTT